MVFGGFGLAFNIITSYLNVRRAAKALKKSSGGREKFHTPPLLLLLPFLFTAVLQIAWLSHPKYNNSYIIDSAVFVPFLCAWGLQFAHMVGRMILAHVTGGREEGRFPIWDWVWVWSLLGAADANLPLIGMYVFFMSLLLFLFFLFSFELCTYHLFFLQGPDYPTFSKEYVVFCVAYVVRVVRCVREIRDTRYPRHYQPSRNRLLYG